MAPTVQSGESEAKPPILAAVGRWGMTQGQQEDPSSHALQEVTPVRSFGHVAGLDTF